MDYNIGDKVRIKSKERLVYACKHNEPVGLSDKLIKYAGWTATITQVTQNCVRIDLPELPGWFWDKDWIVQLKQRTE